MHFKKILLCLSFVLFVCMTISAQDNYEQSIGLRGGSLSGVTYKRFLDRFAAIEAIAGYHFGNGKVPSLTGLYEYHFFISYQLNWYAGGGLSLGANQDSFRTTVEAIIGLEYTTSNFPVSFAIDYKPGYEIINNEIIYIDFALSLRYVF